MAEFTPSPQEQEPYSFHPDFQTLIDFYQNLEGIPEEKRASIIKTLNAVGKIFNSKAFEETHEGKPIEAILIGGSYSRRDKMPNEKSDVDILILEKPRGLAQFGLGVPEYIWDSYAKRTADFVGEKLGVPHQIRHKITVYSIPASGRIVLKHVSAKALLQGGTLVRGEIIDPVLKREYGKLRTGDLPEKSRQRPLSAQV